MRQGIAWLSGSFSTLILIQTLHASNQVFDTTKASLNNAQLNTKKIVTISLGHSSLQTGKKTTLTLLPPFQNHYTLDNSHETSSTIGLFVGVERNINTALVLQWGIEGYAISPIEVSGSIWQFALPEYNNFDYQYKISHRRLLAKTKLLTTSNTAIRPYVSGNIGIAFNKAKTYEEFPKIPEASPMTPFENKQSNTFTYGIGAGTDLTINEHSRVGLGYEFDDLGKVSLNPSPDQATTQTLKINHLYSHQIQVQFTFLI